MDLDFFEVIIRNKRFKEFKSEFSLNSDQIKQLMACAQLSPSLSEIQNFTFIMITDQSLKQQISQQIKNGDWIINAAAIFAVVVLVDENDDVNIVDAIVSSSQLMLAATSLNFGSNLIMDLDEGINETLGVDDNRLTVMALIAIGEPLDEGTQGYKRSLSELLNHNRLGTPYEFQ
jgi:nitroreductase